jgi:hypothetical protein
MSPATVILDWVPEARASVEYTGPVHVSARPGWIAVSYICTPFSKIGAGDAPAAVFKRGTNKGIFPVVNAPRTRPTIKSWVDPVNTLLERTSIKDAL